MTYANGDQYKGQWIFDKPWEGKLKYAGKKKWDKSHHGDLRK